MIDSRGHALNILDRFRETNLRLKTIQESYYRQNRIPSEKRARIHVLVYEVLRWKRRLDLWINSAVHKPIKSMQPRLLTLLRIAAWELIMDEKSQKYAVIHSAVDLAKKRIGKHSAGFVNAVLRKLESVDRTTAPDGAQTAEWLSFPDWLYDRWNVEYKDETVHLCDQLNKPNQLVIRRNVNKIDESTLFTTLEKDGIKCETIEDSDRFYHVVKGGHFLRNHTLFNNGSISFQDRGAGAVVELLDPNPDDIIVDVCAAPGTKALYCAERMNDEGNIYAFDHDRHRVSLGEQDIERHQMMSIEWDVRDATTSMYPIADRMIVDAPCTGTGVIGRRPDIKWRRHPEEIDEMQRLQMSILQNVSQYIKKNGILLYSTCSIEREENWNVVEAFLKLNAEFKLKENLELLPHKTHTDGMFAVTMERIK